MLLAAQGSESPAGFLLTVALMIGAMYLLIIRPQRRRLRAVMATQAALAPGMDVQLTSGIYGTTVNVDQDTVLLEIAPGVHIKVARAAVARVTTPEQAPIAADGAPTG